MKTTTITPQFVDYIPDRLADGILYISERYHTASHKCCCGCGEEVVTPLTPADWKLYKDRDSVTLYPSIGNWSFPCRSHYWIRRNKVIWASPLSQRQIKRVRAKDRADKDAYIASVNRRKDSPTESIPTESPAPRSIGLIDLWRAFIRWLSQ